MPKLFLLQGLCIHCSLSLEYINSNFHLTFSYNWFLFTRYQVKCHIFRMSHYHPSSCIISFFTSFLNIYSFFYRERQNMSGGGAETESKASSRLWPVSTEPDLGLKLMDREIITWAEVGCSTDWATQAPHFFLLFKFIYLLEVGKGRKRGRERESEACSRTMRSWPEPKLDAQPTEPPRRPITSQFLINLSWNFPCTSNHI